MNSRFALVAGIGLFASMARAQPVFATYECLELRVARAQTIVRGTVSKSTGVFIERKGGFFGGYGEDGRARPDGVMRYTITVKVDEVLKGKPARTIELVEETMADDKRFAQWAEQHISFLWFDEGEASKSRTWSNLQGIDAHTNQWNTIRLGGPIPAESTWSSDWPVFAQDFTRVTDQTGILARVRRLARNRAEPLQIHTFKSIWPPDPAYLWASLSVPVNASLEQLARRMIQSPDEFRSRTMVWTPTNAAERAAYANGIEGTRSMVRTEGIRALQYFKSKESIKLIRTFLGDPAVLVSEDMIGRKAREYYVRTAAFEVLQKWEVDVPKPVLQEAIEARLKVRFVSVDSEETEGENGAGANAVDGNPGTIWHTRWQGASPGYPHEIVIEIVPPLVIKGFTYLPRQDASDHGTIKSYELYVSNDNDDFGRPVSKGEFGPGKGRKIASFEPVKCRFVKLKAISEINDLAWASAAEINVIPEDDDAGPPKPGSPEISTHRSGPPMPLREALAKLNENVPELSNTVVGVGAPYESDTLHATYAIDGGSTVTIIARTYESAAAARAGQEKDAAMVSVHWDKVEVIQGVTVYQYARYGGLYFQVGCYTLRLETNRRGGEEMQPLLLKISSVLITDLAPAVEGESAAKGIRRPQEQPFARSAAVPGRSNWRNLSATEISMPHLESDHCCARGRAPSAGRL